MVIQLTRSIMIIKQKKMREKDKRKKERKKRKVVSLNKNTLYI